MRPLFCGNGRNEKEMNNAKWFWFAIGYQTALAYVVSLCVFQISVWVSAGTFGIGTAIGILLLISFLYLLVRPHKESGRLLWEQ